MIIQTSGRLDESSATVAMTVDLSRVVYIRLDGDGDCILFYSLEMGSNGLLRHLARPLTNCVPEADVLPFINPNDWFEVTQIYANQPNGLTCYIHLPDIYSYVIFPVDSVHPIETVGLWGAFGQMRVSMKSIKAIEAEFARRRVS